MPTTIIIITDPTPPEDGEGPDGLRAAPAASEGQCFDQLRALRLLSRAVWRGSHLRIIEDASPTTLALLAGRNE